MATTHSPAERPPTRPPDLTLFTVVHRAMRRDGARLAAAVAGLDVGDAARARALRRWFGGYCAELDGHRAIEDHLWFPVLAARVPTFAQQADRVEREHRLIDEALRRVELALDLLVGRDAAPDAKHESLVATGELSSLLDEHLRFEDADILPLYLRHFTADEYAEVEAKARRLLELRRLPFTVPWILAAATPAERTRLLCSAPLVLKLVWYAGRPRHVRLSAKAFGPAIRGVA